MPKKCKDVDSTDICKFLVKYCKEMETWGKKVRDDIIALERAVNVIERECCDGKVTPTKWGKPGKPGGDPGPPPEPPDWD